MATDISVDNPNEIAKVKHLVAPAQSIAKRIDGDGSPYAYIVNGESRMDCVLRLPASATGGFRLTVCSAKNTVVAGTIRVRVDATDNYKAANSNLLSQSKGLS